MNFKETINHLADKIATIKEKLLIAILLTGLLNLYSCENSAISKGRKAYIEYFNEILKDPSSLVVHKEEIIAKDEVSATFVLDIGAKNSYGGMVRQYYTIKTIGNSVLDAKEYDVRNLLQQKPKKEDDVNFTYKPKTTPIAGFVPSDYVGKGYTLLDSCIYSYLSWEIGNSVNAAKNRDFKKVENLGGILPSGSRVDIMSSKDNCFEVESELHKGFTIYIEQSAIF